jgi:hypothetical protein
MIGRCACRIGLLAFATLSSPVFAADPGADCGQVLTTDRLKSATGLDWAQGSFTKPPKDARLACFFSSAGKPGVPGAWLDIRSEIDPESGYWRTYQNNYQGPHEPAPAFGADAFFINQKTGAWILVTRGGGLTHAVGMVMPSWSEAQVKAYVGEVSRDVAVLPASASDMPLRVAGLIALVAMGAALLGLFARYVRRTRPA